ncbi:MAG: hypothetical protein R3190_10275 [Thermoanaerobaculia bacterium]|nr:hypothetical protein [Thermoanaerobaculia bacterium]
MSQSPDPRPTRFRRSGTAIVALVVAVAAAVAGVTAASRPDDGARSADSAPTAAEATSSGRTGVRAWVDPDTGTLSVPPPGALAREQPFALRDGLGRSSAGLYEVQLPNGAIKVDLQGRFRSAVVATVEPAGGYRLDCETTPAEEPR